MPSTSTFLFGPSMPLRRMWLTTQLLVFVFFFDLVERIGAELEPVVAARHAAHLDVLIGDVPVVDVRPAVVDALAELVGHAVAGVREQAVGRVVLARAVALLAPRVDADVGHAEAHLLRRRDRLVAQLRATLVRSPQQRVGEARIVIVPVNGVVVHRAGRPIVGRRRRCVGCAARRGRARSGRASRRSEPATRSRPGPVPRLAMI